MQYEFERYLDGKMVANIIVHHGASREDAERRAREAFSPSEDRAEFVLLNTFED